jgi:hypothetical protein
VPRIDTLNDLPRHRIHFVDLRRVTIVEKIVVSDIKRIADNNAAVRLNPDLIILRNVGGC